MSRSQFILALAFLGAGTLPAQEAQVKPLMSKDLPECPGKEGLMLTVVYPPGASDPIHRHNAHAFVYVLEGSIVMQQGCPGADTSQADVSRSPLQARRWFCALA